MLQEWDGVGEITDLLLWPSTCPRSRDGSMISLTRRLSSFVSVQEGRLLVGSRNWKLRNDTCVCLRFGMKAPERYFASKVHLESSQGFLGNGDT